MAGSKYSGKRISSTSREEQGSESLLEERTEIINWLKNVHFRRRIFGGVDERTVWRKISELDALYTKALEAERIRCNTLIEEAKRSANRSESNYQIDWLEEGGDRLD
ncbi:MAG: hypothetical protein IKE00_00080 [Oscillospiraceae bacterium]|nr:hypothetical protein [Oscillospiraceae bacterium]